MDLVSNYIGELAASQFGGKNDGTTSNVDLNDSTFSDLLEKQMNNTVDNNPLNSIGQIGPMSGIDIGLFDGSVPSFNSVNSVNEAYQAAYNRFENAKEYTTSEILTFFPSLFDSKPTMTQTETNGIFDFERKFAANSYGKYAKNIVMNLGEFVSDALR